MKWFIPFLALTGCAASDDNPWSLNRFYWDQPQREWFWLPDGTEHIAIAEATKSCDAKVEWAVAMHAIVPPGYDMKIFKFLEPIAAVARRCTIERLRAVPALTTYEKKS